VNIPGATQYNPGQVTAPSAVQGMSPQMQQRLAMIRQLRAQRGQQVPGRGMMGQVQVGTPPPGSTPMNPPTSAQYADMMARLNPQAGIQQALGQAQNVPVAGGMINNGQAYPQMSGTAQAPNIGQMARPAGMAQPVTTQGPVNRGLPVLPNGLAQRMGIFR